MKSSKFIYFLLIILPNLFESRIFKHHDNPDAFAPALKLIQSKGYVGEEHHVITDDGYILTIHRIPYGRLNSTNDTARPVVFIQHGLLDSSSSMVLNFQNQSIGFVMADAGFDVWMGNVRGNTYGLRHVVYNTRDERFWDFSWSEMGKYDIPAMIDYILQYTNQKQLFYIGHSQGTMVLFSQLGTNSKLASQIKVFAAMAPVAYLSYIRSPIEYLAKLGVDSNQLFWYNVFGKKDFLPSKKAKQLLSDRLCSIEAVDKTLCKYEVFILMGPSTNINITRIPVYKTHDPSGTSTKNMVHFAQGVISGKFQMYDYGSDEENFKHYNQTQPPQYSLKNVHTPTAIYWARNDWLADPVDVSFIRSELPNIVDDFMVDNYDHIDFIWAVNAKNALYDRIIKLFYKYL